MRNRLAMNELQGRVSTVFLTVLAFAALSIARQAQAAPPVAVNEAIPNAAEQGTETLDVTVKGRGFDESAVVRFLRSGSEENGGVIVNETRFIDTKTLVVNITIGELAVVDLYDIEAVMLESGRKGKGTERFSVLEKDSNAGGLGEVHLCATFADPAPIGDPALRSDLLSGTYCHLENSEKWLVARIGNVNGNFQLATAKTTREFILDYPDCGRLIDAPDCSTDAVLSTRFEWTDEGVGPMSTGFVLDLRTIAEGETAWVDFQAAFPSGSKSTPHLIVYGGSNHDMCGEPLPVTRVDENTWVIEATTEEACLVEIKKGNVREVHRPGFSLPFRLELRRQN